MVDEIYDRHYQEGREALHAGLDRLFGRIGSELGKTLDTFHRLQWSAPWANSQRRRGRRHA